MITRYFNLFLNAGSASPLVISANQYDHGEQWVFTLYSQLGVKYEPSSGAIVGIKADNLGIINSGSVDSEGRVVINETTQMTAVAGRAIFELLIDGDTHGTANFYVEVEPKPGDNADYSASDLSLIQEAINSIAIAGSGAPAVATLASQMTDEGKVYLYAGSETGYTAGDWYYYNGSAWIDGGKYGGTVDSTLTISGAAADAKKTGDEITELKSEISLLSGVPTAVKNALDTLLQNVAFKNDDLYTDELAVVHNWATSVNLISISAVFNQGQNEFSFLNSLEDLKEYLTVTANYSDGTSSAVTDYTLTGVLETGTQTITVSYSGFTTTFTVVVTDPDNTWIYRADVDGKVSDYAHLSTANSTATTETLGDGFDNFLVVPVSTTSQGIGRIALDTTSNTNAELTMKVRFNALPHSSSVSSDNPSGLRLQLSNGTTGAQLYADGYNGFSTFNGNTAVKNIKNLAIDTWYLLKLVLNGNTQQIYIDNELVHTGALSSSYATVNTSFLLSKPSRGWDQPNIDMDIACIIYKNND